MAKQQPVSFVIGIHPLLELLKAKKRAVYHVYTTNPAPRAFAEIKKLLPHHIPISTLSRDQLSHKVGTTDHQGVVALVAPLPIRGKPFEPQRHPFVLLLDGIQDPRNLGAIIRSAFCTGATGIIIPSKQSAPLNEIVCKASAGLIEHVDIYQPASSASALNDLKQAGYHLYLATLAGEDVRTVPYQTPLCLVIGSEGTGISKQLLSQGTAITIPQLIPSISYNASVAAGILLFYISSTIKRL
jgi:23S rRNA (guanosine2251-2'-O)-methyltransferase